MTQNEIMYEVYNYEFVFIYGAGEYGQTLAHYMMKTKAEVYDKKVCGFIVTKKNTDNYIAGKPVFSLSEIKKKLGSNMLVIVAVSSAKQKEIIEKIEYLPVGKVSCMSETDYLKMKENVNQVMVGKEILDAISFNRAVDSCEWITRKNFAPGGMAVNYKYLYILFNILDSKKAKNYLDIGLGQTSKLIGEYANHYKDIHHTIIEADSSWRDYFTERNNLDNSEIIMCDYESKLVNGKAVRIFARFNDVLKGRKWDYISIDAPLGSDFYSRVDILDILPDCLNESWVIMMDDVGRPGEEYTVAMIEKILHESNIGYVKKVFVGYEKDFVVLASSDNRFYCSI